MSKEGSYLIFATRILKNGDFIEVNANKGIIKILKRNS
jgi:hypothetical protein